MARVLITGAGRGIGLQLVKEFIERGHEVIGTVRSLQGKENINRLSEECGREVEVYEVEVTSKESVEQFSNHLNNREIDILINNAGVIGGDNQEVTGFDFAEWSKTFEVNAVSPMRMTLSLLPAIRQSQKPKIVTISSIMGSLARERTGSIAYRSSKAAVNKAMQCLALELKSEGIGVYLMHPGWVRTEMGGPEADISVEESAAGIAQTILTFTIEDSAKFWQYDGALLEW